MALLVLLICDKMARARGAGVATVWELRSVVMIAIGKETRCLEEWLGLVAVCGSGGVDALFVANTGVVAGLSIGNLGS